MEKTFHTARRETILTGKDRPIQHGKDISMHMGENRPTQCNDSGEKYTEENIDPLQFEDRPIHCEDRHTHLKCEEVRRIQCEEERHILYGEKLLLLSREDRPSHLTTKTCTALLFCKTVKHNICCQDLVTDCDQFKICTNISFNGKTC